MVTKMWIHIFGLYLWINFVLTQNPCRVNVIFGIDASSFVEVDGNADGQALVFGQLSAIQNAYHSWTIAPTSVRATIPKPMGCANGGSWTLQDSSSSLDSVAKSVNRFVYTCFQQYSLSSYIEALNQEILQNQAVDQGVRYVFVIFSASTDTNDVQNAIALRQKYFDPLGYGLVIVRVRSPTASNLVELQTAGLFDLADSGFVNDLTAGLCAAPSPTPYYCPTNFRANVLFELDLTDCTNETAIKEVNAVYSIIQNWKISPDFYKVNLPDPIGLVAVGMHYGNYTSENNTVYSNLASIITSAIAEAPCMGAESISSFLRPFYYQVVANLNYPDFGIPHAIVLFTRTQYAVERCLQQAFRQQNDVVNAITFRKTYLDPYNVKLYLVSVGANVDLSGLSSNGKIYDINDPNLMNLINGDICSTPPLLRSPKAM